MSSLSDAYFSNKDKIKAILVDKLEYTRVGKPSVVEDYVPLDTTYDFKLRVSTGSKDVEITFDSVSGHIMDILELTNDEITLENIVDFLRFYGYPPAVRLSRILFIDEVLKDL